MKALFIILIVFLAGCVPSATVCVCPTTDVVVSGDVEGGAAIFAIPKGTFNNPDNFWTLEEFNDELRMMQRGEGL